MELVEMDMRFYTPDMKADLVVSELIGGFGCNELAPECLDGAMHLFKGQQFCKTLVYIHTYSTVIILIFVHTNIRPLAQN